MNTRHEMKRELDLSPFDAMMLGQILFSIRTGDYELLSTLPESANERLETIASEIMLQIQQKSDAPQNVPGIDEETSRWISETRKILDKRMQGKP